MTSVFADSFFFIALLVEKDAAHARALEFYTLQRPLITTTWVLIEVADALCDPGARAGVATLISFLRHDPRVTIVEPDRELFDAGFALYRARDDKSWSLTDCLSFEVMRRHNLADALTGDRHFEQAGFTALLK